MSKYLNTKPGSLEAAVYQAVVGTPLTEKTGDKEEYQKCTSWATLEDTMWRQGMVPDVLCKEWITLPSDGCEVGVLNQLLIGKHPVSKSK